MSLLIGSSLPAGYEFDSPAALTDPNWLRSNSQVVARATYPALSALFPTVGTFTPTIRTMADAPSSLAIATDGTNIVMAGASGFIQRSTNNGDTWTAIATTTGFSVNAITYTGTNFVAVGGTPGSGGTSFIMYSTDGGATWAAATGDGEHPTGTGYTSCSNNGSGNVVACTQLGNYVFISTNGGETFTVASTQVTSTTSGVPIPIIYSGSQFLIFNSTSQPNVGLQVSTTGVGSTWSTIPILPWGGAPIIAAASDGNGNVIALPGQANGTTVMAPVVGQPLFGQIFISNDGGNTWHSENIQFSGESITYANGRWFISVSNLGDFLVSGDMKSWIYVPVFGMQVGLTSAVSLINANLVYCGTNYVVVNENSSTSIITNVEDTTKMYLPPSFGGVQKWIKLS